jgi:crotonobetainyl-CoA:carnitine CoA-transferase CaiB-like acyl-CoA transferase
MSAADAGSGDRRTGPRVVDFSTHLSGPLAAHLLAEMGADVIKVESPRGGDGNRTLKPVVEGVDAGIFHIALNGGARSITVNSRSEEWPQVIAGAARWADAVIVGSRPKDAAKRGLDFASLRRHNDRLVYCQVSGFGEQGEWAGHTAHGQTIDGFAGMVPVEWQDGLPQTPVGFRTSGTTLGGVFAALGVLAGLYRRDHGPGTAQHVGVSLWESALWWGWRDTTTLANMGTRWNDYQDLGSRYRMYGTADDRAILICPIEQKFWERFCDLADLPAELRARGMWPTTGMDFGAGPEYADEMAVIVDRVRRHTLDEWIAILGDAEIPFAPALTLEEAMNSRHAQVEGAMREFELHGHAVRAPASPVRIREGEEPTPQEPMRPPPDLGEHTDDVLRQLGLDDLVGRV